MQPHWSTTVLAMVLTVMAAAFFAAFVLYGVWIDGRRQKMRDAGKHPVTTGDGHVEARREDQRG